MNVLIMSIMAELHGLRGCRTGISLYNRPILGPTVSCFFPVLWILSCYTCTNLT